MTPSRPKISTIAGPFARRYAPIPATERSKHVSMLGPRIAEDLRLAIVTWIETKYHRRRHQERLGKLTPVAFETIYIAANVT